MLRATLSAVFAFSLFLTIHALDFHFLLPTEKTNRLLWAALLGWAFFALIIAIILTSKGRSVLAMYRYAIEYLHLHPGEKIKQRSDMDKTQQNVEKL